MILLEPLPRLVVFNASFLISRVVHNNWLYLNRVNIFYSIFILMRFKSLFKNFPNCGWFWIKSHLHFWAKKTCIFVSAFVGYTSYLIVRIQKNSNTGFFWFKMWKYTENNQIYRLGLWFDKFKMWKNTENIQIYRLGLWE